MVDSFWGRRFILPLSFVLLIAVSEGYCHTKTVDFIYINSSEDEAAGGHTAMRLGQNVFHCQYTDDGFFLLAKKEWSDFRYQYNDLENRTLSIASLPLSYETYLKIKSRFLSRYLLQEKRFSYLEQLIAEKRYFQRLLSGKGVIPVKGLGLYSRDLQKDPVAQSLKQFIHHQLGPSYLDDLYSEITTELVRARKNLTPDSLEQTDLDLYLPAFSSSGKMQDYFDLIALREAVAVLINCHPVRDEILLLADGDIWKLGAAEWDQLRIYHQKIRRSIVSLLTSFRPGRGHALLLQAARFQALGRSIQDQRMFTLDPFPDHAEQVPREHLMSVNVFMQGAYGDNSKGMNHRKNHSPSLHRTYFDQLRIERERDAKYTKELFFSAPENENIAYNQLESALGRLWEIKRTDTEMVRIEGGPLLPGKSGLVLEATNTEKEDLLRAHTQAEANAALFEKQLLEAYNYNLFYKNCVTELFETLYSSFKTTEQSKKELGGYLTPGDHFSFVPFKSFDLVQKVFPVTTVEILPSYRKRQLEKRYDQNGVRSLLEESNTLTSKVYDPWEGDSTFLFFTDSALLLRPVLGAINLLYAAVGSVGGILTSPLDRGDLLKRSVRGMVFSLPELAFINIRKGTFPAVSINEDERAMTQPH